MAANDPEGPNAMLHPGASSSLREAFEVQRASEGPRRSSVRRSLATRLSKRASEGYSPHVDYVGHDDISESRGSIRSIFNQETEDALEAHDSEQFNTLISSFRGYIVQAMLLVCVVVSYAGPPIAINWAKTVGFTDEGKPIKTSTFLEISVVLFAKAGCVVISIIAAFVMDRMEGGNTYRTMLMNFRAIIPWIPITAGYVIADIAEVMANGRIDAAVYTVMSQSRLVGTAIALKIFVGIQRSWLQWSILLALSCLVVGWKLIPNKYAAAGKEAPDTESLGLIMTTVKCTLSVLLGVFSQKILKKSETPVIILQGQNCLAGATFTLLFIPVVLHVLLPQIDDPWIDESGNSIGFFGGKPVPENCAGGPNKGDATGWDGKVVVVLAIYIFREVFTTMCLSVFDALVKNLCNAFAAVTSYYLSVFMLKDNPFNVAKGVLTVVIGLEIMHYAMVERYNKLLKDLQ